MNYIYTPNEIAVFLLKANFSLTEEQGVLNSLWEEKKHISKRYRQNKYSFVLAVQREINSYSNLDRIDELDLIMRDVDPNYILQNPEQERDYILHFFIVIRLKLLYTKGKGFYKIKFRRLLKCFGYKRRSQTFVQNLTHTMAKLSLKPYLRGHVPCDLNLIDIDDMVIIRLKQTKKVIAE
jgi:hypothetical protein